MKNLKMTLFLILVAILPVVACNGDSEATGATGDLARLRQEVDWIKIWMGGWEGDTVAPPSPPSPTGPMPVEDWHEALYEAFCNVEEALSIPEADRFCHLGHDPDEEPDPDHSAPPPTPPYGP